MAGAAARTTTSRGRARSRNSAASSLKDVLAAYDALAGQRGVDPESILVIGSSYGGYLAAILTELRPVRWLALRVPALYKDEDWALPKEELRKYGLAEYRRGPVKPDQNRALKACAAFEGDVLILESEGPHGPCDLLVRVGLLPTYPPPLSMADHVGRVL